MKSPLSYLPKLTLKSVWTHLPAYIQERAITTVWFINKSRGLEHGFTLTRPQRKPPGPFAPANGLVNKILARQPFILFSKIRRNHTIHDYTALPQVILKPSFSSGSLTA